ncbi:MAG: lytic transglycosylase domain-containing protein [Bryobacterales bacterium]|nr:lytic transglycosylase domain-containing protein [Bryobacterales bacterium]MEB2361337.1 lytic transglycosylase domain-containing protein [Bryobacterales bacterium]
MRVARWMIALAFLLPRLWGQAPDPYEAMRTAMEASIARQQDSVSGSMEPAAAKQRASIQAQARSATPAPGESASTFFTVSWPRPPGFATEMQRMPECRPVSQDEIGDAIQEAAEREGLTPDLLRAIIHKESSYLPCAVSPKGALGLMQLMPATASAMKVENPFDPKQNIDGGSRFLRKLLNRYGNDLTLALGAYNAGPGNVDTYGGLPPFPETIGYVGDILSKLGVQ